MNPDPAPVSQWDRTTTARVLRWLLSWRTIRLCLLGLAWVATGIALFYAEENWRGQHAWDKARRELVAHGAQLDLAAFIPKSVPNDQNFATTPFVQSWFDQGNKPDQVWDTNFWAAEARIGTSRFQGNRGDRHFRDLAARALAFAAVRKGQRTPWNFESDDLDLESRAKAGPAVLEALKPNEPMLAELRAASQRPSSNYPIIYDLENPWGILLPHLGNIKRATQILVLKACAELALGQSGPALEDVQLMLYLADSLKDEPFCVSYLVRVACVQIASSAVWEGLAEHVWSEDQLQQLQTRFQQYDFVTDAMKPLAAERASAILTVDLLLNRKYQFSQLFQLDVPAPAIVENLGDAFARKGSVTELLVQIAPEGWYRQEQLNYCRLLHSLLESRFRPMEKRIVASPINSSAATADLVVPLNSESPAHQKSFSDGLATIAHHRLIATLLLPGIANLPQNSARGQVTADEAALACALERYRLANNQSPEKLEALQPRYLSSLPHDVLTGQPYQYRRTHDGEFVLYSVGWNEKDDGGVPGQKWFDETRGDWVWRYPPK